VDARHKAGHDEIQSAKINSPARAPGGVGLRIQQADMIEI
jgi:hypothetical protein